MTLAPSRVSAYAHSRTGPRLPPVTRYTHAIRGSIDILAMRGCSPVASPGSRSTILNMQSGSALSPQRD